MLHQNTFNRSRITMILQVVRCFNTAAFAALAFFYFTSYTLSPPPTSFIQLKPVPPAH